MELILNWSGPVIYTALGVSALYGVFCAVLVLRKIKEKRFPSQAAATEFLDQMRSHLAQRDFDGAAALCDSPPYWSKAVPQLSLVALSNRQRPQSKLRQVVADRFEREVLADLAYRHSWIGTIVKTAPMLGLQGTVCGMILAFGKIAMSQETGTKPSMLASEISLALYTTAIGLAVAIPLVLLAAFVQVRMAKLQDSVQEHMGMVLEDLEAATSA